MKDLGVGGETAAILRVCVCVSVCEGRLSGHTVQCVSVMEVGGRSRGRSYTQPVCVSASVNGCSVYVCIISAAE